MTDAPAARVDPRYNPQVRELLERLHGIVGDVAAPVRPIPTVLDWEIVIFVGLWYVHTRDLAPPIRALARRIVAHVGRLMSARRDPTSREVDQSLRLTLYALDWWLRRPPMGRRARGPPPGWWPQARDALLRRWSTVDHRVDDHNTALLLCNLMGVSHTLAAMAGQPPCLPPAASRLVRTLETHWRRRYRVPAHVGHPDPQAEEAAYVATHLVLARTTGWGAGCPAVENGRRRRPASLRPECRLLRKLVDRPNLVREIGLDAAAEVLLCALATGVPVVPRRRSVLVRTLLRCWRRTADIPENTHFIQHVACNILYALRRCPRRRAPTPPSSPDVREDRCL